MCAAIRERDIEKYLRERVRAAGGRAYKFVSPGNAGVPDRLVLFPGARAVFVELKAPGRKPTTLQVAQQRRIAALGFEVLVIDSKQGVDKLVQEYAGGDLLKKYPIQAEITEQTWYIEIFADTPERAIDEGRWKLARIAKVPVNQVMNARVEELVSE